MTEAPVPAPLRSPAGKRRARLERVPFASGRGVGAILVVALWALLLVALPVVGIVDLILYGPGEEQRLTKDLVYANVVVQVLFLGLLPVLYLSLVRPGESLLRLLGLEWTRRTPIHLAIGLGVAIASLFVLGYALYFLERANLFEEEPSKLIDEFARLVRAHPEFILLMPLAAAVTEEICYRGWLQPRVGLWASAALFGLSHVVYGTLLQLAIPFVLGILFGLLYRYTRTLWVPMAAHFFFDLIQLGGLYFEGAEGITLPRLGVGFL